MWKFALDKKKDFIKSEKKIKQKKVIERTKSGQREIGINILKKVL